MSCFTSAALTSPKHKSHRSSRPRNDRENRPNFLRQVLHGFDRAAELKRMDVIKKVPVA
jgi:hypothetical protein